MEIVKLIKETAGIDITKKAKELYGVTTLDDINMEQYKELKEIAING